MKLTSQILLFILFFVCTDAVGQETWRSIVQESKMAKRHENAFVKVGNQFVLLGGRGIKPVEIFDTETATWKKGKTPPVEMSHFQAVSYHGLVYVMGGLNGGWPSETPLRHVYIYDPIEDLWTVGPEIPRDRQRGAAGVAVYNDKLYLVCGIVNGHTSGWVAWFDEYDPNTNSWKKMPNAPRARDHFQAAIVGDQLIVSGGRKSGYQGQGFEATIAETDIYDFKTGNWRTLQSPSGDIPTQRAGCTAVVNGKDVIYIGGESGSQKEAHSEVEVLNIENGTWTKLPNLLKGRHGTQAVLFEGNLYIAAGCGNRGGSPELDSFERLPVSGNKMKELPVTQGALGFSTDKLDFGRANPFGKKSFNIELSNAVGSQGVLLTYLISTEPSIFKVDFPFDLPYLIKPGEKVNAVVHFTPNTTDKSEGELIIKKAEKGKQQPLVVQLVGNSN